MAGHVHLLPRSDGRPLAYARHGKCRHPTLEDMPIAEFRRYPTVRCDVDGCKTYLGKLCPDCKAVY
jgi:hypothetical protein